MSRKGLIQPKQRRRSASKEYIYADGRLVPALAVGTGEVLVLLSLQQREELH